jgi:DNA mismatch repair protein MutS2
MATLAKREHNVRERERLAERDARQDTRRYLLDARAEIDRTIRDLKARAAGELDEAGREARQRAEQLAAKQNVELERLEREDANVKRRDTPPGTAAKVGTIAAGSPVAVATLGGKVGRVVELRDDDAVVVVGALKLTVERSSLTPVEAAELREVTGWTGDLPDVHVPSEIDVRGMRPDEAEAAVLQALDGAVRADLRMLRIIHGKGTGALRDRVGEMLRKDTRVREFRLGAWNEGGAGVTVAELA